VYPDTPWCCASGCTSAADDGKNAFCVREVRRSLLEAKQRGSLRGRVLGTDRRAWIYRLDLQAAGPKVDVKFIEKSGWCSGAFFYRF